MYATGAAVVDPSVAPPKIVAQKSAGPDQSERKLTISRENYGPGEARRGLGTSAVLVVEDLAACAHHETAIQASLFVRRGRSVQTIRLVTDARPPA